MKNIIYIIVLILFISSCDKENPITKGRMVYVDGFQTESELHGEQLDFIRSVGVFGCEVKYPYLLLNLSDQENNIAVYNLATGTFAGEYFAKGNSGDEYLDFNIINDGCDSLFRTVDPKKKRLKSFVLEERDDSCRLLMVKEMNYKIPGDIYSLFVKGDTVYAYKTYSDEKGLYYVNRANGMEIPLFCQEVRRKDLNKMLTLADGLKGDGSKAVFLTGVWDRVDIVSLDGTGAHITLTTSGESMTWDEYKEKEDLPDYYISLPRCNNDYILTLHDNQKNREFLLFDWDGNGIARYSIKEKLIDFAVDWTQMVVYGLTAEEQVYVYRINAVNPDAAHRD